MAMNIEGFVKTVGEYLGDLLLVIPSCRKKRMDAWEQHVNTFDLIASRGKPPRLGTKRIDFVAGHLDILDRKFSSLLTFHGLMASVVGLYLNVSLPHPIHHL